jgi:DNA-binding CsgD family transcriptional regulator
VSESFRFSLFHSREFFAISEFLDRLYQIDEATSFREHLVDCFRLVFPELKISLDEFDWDSTRLPDSHGAIPELSVLFPHIRNARRFATQMHRNLPVSDCSESLAQYNLTPREAEVAAWIREGKRDKEIAVILGISSRTVEKHVHQVLEKLQVENRCSAISILSGKGPSWKTLRSNSKSPASCLPAEIRSQMANRKSPSHFTSLPA